MTGGLRRARRVLTRRFALSAGFRLRFRMALALLVVTGLAIPALHVGAAGASGPGAVSFVEAWGWGVVPHANQFEACTSTCQSGVAMANAGGVDNPTQIAVHGGDVYVADPGNYRIDEYSSAGAFIRAWGWGVADGQNQFEICTSACQMGAAGSGNGEFNEPEGVAVDSTGDVYVADSNNARIEKFDATGNFLAKWGGFGRGAGQLEFPFGLAADRSGDIYVADVANNRIDEFTSAGGFIEAWGDGVADGANTFETCTNTCQAGSSGAGAGAMAAPYDVATDGSGAVYVADGGNYRVDKFASDAFVEAWGWGVFDGASHFEICTSSCQTGQNGSGAGEFSSLNSVATDSSGNVYTDDFASERVNEFSADGTFTEAWGWGVADGGPSFETCTTQCQAGSAGGDAGRMTGPWGVAADGSGNVYVAEYTNERISKFSVSTSAPPGLTSAAQTTFTVGSPGAFTVTTSGSPTPSLSESGALPGGVTFQDNGDGTAGLSGTPAAGTAGTYPLTITAHNGSGPDATQQFTLTVNPAPSPGPSPSGGGPPPSGGSPPSSGSPPPPSAPSSPVTPARYSLAIAAGPTIPLVNFQGFPPSGVTLTQTTAGGHLIHTPSNRQFRLTVTYLVQSDPGGAVSRWWQQISSGKVVKKTVTLESSASSQLFTFTGVLPISFTRSVTAGAQPIEVVKLAYAAVTTKLLPTTTGSGGKFAHGVASIPIRCSASVSICAGTLTLEHGVTSTNGGVTLGKAAYQVPGGRSADVIVPLNNSGRALVARGSSLTLTTLTSGKDVLGTTIITQHSIQVSSVPSIPADTWTVSLSGQTYPIANVTGLPPSAASADPARAGPGVIVPPQTEPGTTSAHGPVTFDLIHNAPAFQAWFQATLAGSAKSETVLLTHVRSGRTLEYQLAQATITEAVRRPVTIGSQQLLVTRVTLRFASLS